MGYKNQKGRSIIWEGDGVNEVGRRADTGEIIIKIDPKYFRPTEVDQLLGDSSKAKKILGWSPKLTLDDLISEMIDCDKREAEKEKLLKSEGYPHNLSIEAIPQIMEEN